MKVLVLFCVVAAAYGQHLLHPNGASTNFRAQDLVGNYHFGYNEGHPSGGTFRRESGDIAGNKVGSYGLSDADGRRRVVNYVADAAGFRATINTNEPGVDPSKDPAATAVNKGVLAPGLLHHAALPYAHYGGLWGHHGGYYF